MPIFRELPSGARQYEVRGEVVSELYGRNSSSPRRDLTLQGERLSDLAECGYLSEFRW